MSQSAGIRRRFRRAQQQTQKHTQWVAALCGHDWSAALRVQPACEGGKERERRESKIQLSDSDHNAARWLGGERRAGVRADLWFVRLHSVALGSFMRKASLGKSATGNSGEGGTAPVALKAFHSQNAT